MQRTGSRIIIWISAIASFCTISGFILTQILQKNLMEVLKIELPLPLWCLLLIIGFFLLIFFFAKKRNKNKKNSQEITAFKEPRVVTNERAQSAAPLSSKFIQSPTGSISIWVYLHPFGEGIRKLENNRYIVSHATNNGSTKTINDKEVYVNVFSLCRGPMKWDPPRNPAWKLWLLNNKGEGRCWTFDDSEEIRPGWHHFIIRWDDGKPILELLIDGDLKITKSNYKKYWPNEYSNQILLGTWANRLRIHFVETWLWRAIPSTIYLDDAWLNRELSITRPKSLL